jgi:hemerythrin
MNKRAIAELMSDWALNHVTKDDAKIAEYLLASPGE